MRSWWSRNRSADLLERIVDFFRAFLLFELLKGLRLTGRHLFARKLAVRYPDDKAPMNASGAFDRGATDGR